MCFIPPFYSADIQQIITDPVQAVSDAVDEVSGLLGKFQGEDKLSNSSLQGRSSQYYNIGLLFVGLQSAHQI